MEERNKFEENPKLMAGVAMSLAREREELRKRAGEVGEAAEKEAKGGIVTAIAVVVVLVGTLALMLFMNSA